jgi:hypothetical protein
VGGPVEKAGGPVGTADGAAGTAEIECIGGKVEQAVYPLHKTCIFIAESWLSTEEGCRELALG